jgi:hypothetical protein
MLTDLLIPLTPGRARSISVLAPGLAALCLALAAPGAAASGFRCDTELIDRGMTPFEVLERCGDPVFELAWVQSQVPGVYVHVIEWVYNLGANKFRRLLTFENGRLIRIETRDKPFRRLDPTPPTLSTW